MRNFVFYKVLLRSKMCANLNNQNNKWLHSWLVHWFFGPRPRFCTSGSDHGTKKRCWQTVKPKYEIDQLKRGIMKSHNLDKKEESNLEKLTYIFLGERNEKRLNIYWILFLHWPRSKCSSFMREILKYTTRKVTIFRCCHQLVEAVNLFDKLCSLLCNTTFKCGLKSLQTFLFRVQISLFLSSGNWCWHNIIFVDLILLPFREKTLAPFLYIYPCFRQIVVWLLINSCILKMDCSSDFAKSMFDFENLTKPFLEPSIFQIRVGPSLFETM